MDEESDKGFFCAEHVILATIISTSATTASILLAAVIAHIHFRLYSQVIPSRKRSLYKNRPEIYICLDTGRTSCVVIDACVSFSRKRPGHEVHFGISRDREQSVARTRLAKRCLILTR